MDDTGQELEGKGDMKQEDGRNSKGPSIEKVTNSKASKPTSNSTFKVKKTNKQKNNTADISKYFEFDTNK